ncbi:amidohydrolase family protein [Hyphomonas sp.]|uniref:amidohydrolase family protein n=1 Tax=Hyphomonas sp. TaxID=87 RepID=UPI0025B8AC60|nr:amidohydrolase family protein [Hyphomonas sp.]
MKIPITAALAALLAPAIGACASASDPTIADLAIRNVTVVSPERAGLLEHADVLIDEGRIVAVGPAAPGWLAAHEFDGSGLFLTPGLIDGHVHLYHATGLKRRYTDSFDALYAAFQAQQPRSFLYFGYTTVAELNADFDTNRDFESAPLHPDLIHCGQGLVLSNDFMATDFESEEEFLAAFPNFLHDRFTTPDLPAGFDPADHTPAATVAKIAESSGRCVKLYYEEALWWPAESRPPFGLPSEAIVREVVAEAHARGMPVLLHGTTPAAYTLAAHTGVDAVAHGLWDWEGAYLGHDEIPAAATQAIEEVAQAGVAVQPTVQTLNNTVSLFETALLDEPGLKAVLPPAYIDYLRTDGQKGRDDFIRRNGAVIADAFDKGEAASADPEAMVRTYQARLERLVSQMNTAGTHFLFGTDTAVGGSGWGNPPGLNGYWEMQDWAKAGIPLATIFKAATLDNAAAFGIDGEVGSVEVGKRANLLLLSGNPLDSLEAYDEIDKVVLGGTVIDRSALAAGN